MTSAVGVLSERRLRELRDLCDALGSSPTLILHEDLAFFREFVETFEVPRRPTDLDPKSAGAKGGGRLEDEEEDEEEEEPGRWDDPIWAELTSRLQSCPSALAYARRAAHLSSLGAFESALEDCERAIALNPDSANAHRMRGIVSCELGHWEVADASFNLAQSVDYDESVSAMHAEAKRKLRAKATVPPSAEPNPKPEPNSRANPEPGKRPGSSAAPYPGSGSAGLPFQVSPDIMAQASEILKDPAALQGLMGSPMVQEMLQAMPHHLGGARR